MSVRLRYKGGRTQSKQYWNREAYIFEKETDWITDVPEGLAIRLIAGGQFEIMPAEKELPIIDDKEKQNLICKKCSFKAKSEQGLFVHYAMHRREDKNV